MPNILGTGVADADHIVKIDEVVERRLSGIPLDQLLVYFIDTVTAEALPFLADQFNVLGIKGYAQSETEQDKRELIKRAIELHRYKGTPWAVREGIRSVGFKDAEIIEGVGLDHNGTFLRDGSQRYEGGNPFQFRVRLDLGDSSGMTADRLRMARQVINEYKNVRSHLFDIGFIMTMDDIIEVDDVLVMEINGVLEDDLLNRGSYNGEISYNGNESFLYATDAISLNITNLGVQNSETF